VQQHSGNDHDAAAPEGDGVAPVGEDDGLQGRDLSATTPLPNGVVQGLT